MSQKSPTSEALVLAKSLYARCVSRGFNANIIANNGNRVALTMLFVHGKIAHKAQVYYLVMPSGTIQGQIQISKELEDDTDYWTLVERMKTSGFRVGLESQGKESFTLNHDNGHVERVYIIKLSTAVLNGNVDAAADMFVKLVELVSAFETRLAAGTPDVKERYTASASAPPVPTFDTTLFPALSAIKSGAFKPVAMVPAPVVKGTPISFAALAEQCKPTKFDLKRQELERMLADEFCKLEKTKAEADDLRAEADALKAEADAEAAALKALEERIKGVRASREKVEAQNATMRAGKF